MSDTPSKFAAGMEWDPGHNPWLIAISVTLATFMEVLDTTIVTVALPHISGNLSASVDESTWVLTSYLVSNAIVLPLSGWLSSIFGRKRFYMGCVVIFTLSSAMCGFAPSLGWLVFFRVVQGIGGGGLQPSEQSILVDSFPRHRRGMSMALYGIAVICAPILGPTLGGWITDNFTWRWVFFINIPVGILSLTLTSHFVKDPPWLVRLRKAGARQIDFMGLSLIALGLGALQIMLDKGEREDWFSSRFILTFGVLAGVGIFSAIVWEWRSKTPLVDLHLLKSRNFAAATILMFALGFVLMGSTVILPMLLQTLLGYSATDSGLVLSPGALVTMAMMPLVGLLVAKFDPRWLIIVGICGLTLSLNYMAGFSLGIDFRTAVISRMIFGFGMAFQFVPINTAAYASLPPDRSNAASGIINLARNLGGSCGISIVETMLSRNTQAHLNVLVAHLTPYDHDYQTSVQALTQALAPHSSSLAAAGQQATGIIYNQTVRQAAMLAYIDAFRFLCVLFLCMIPLVFLMKKATPHKAPMGH